MNNEQSSSEQEIRELARKRLEHKRAFWVMLAVAVLVSLIVTAVWALSGMGYFWPAWTYFGLGIPVVVLGWTAYGPGTKPITESDVDREVRRMTGKYDAGH